MGYWKLLQGGDVPTKHASSHEADGSDEISVEGLEGYLAWPQTASEYPAHASTHEAGGGDEVDVGGLSGVLADAQIPQQHALTGERHTGFDFLDDYLDASALAPYATKEFVADGYVDQATFGTHAARHEAAGADEISVEGLSGVLADAQDPQAHALTGSKHTGFEVLDSYLSEVPGTYLQYADIDSYAQKSLLDSYLSEVPGTYLQYADIDSYAQKSLLDSYLSEVPGTYLQYSDIDGYTTLAVFNDHSARHENGGADEISVAGLSGVLQDAQVPQQHGFTDPAYHSGIAAALDSYLLPADIAHFLTFADVDGYATKEFVADGYTSQATFEDHSARHEVGGADEISVAGLSGSLADPQTPTQHGFTDPAYHSGQSVLDSYAQLPLTVLDGYVAVSDYNSHASRHEVGGADEISVAGLEGYLQDPQDAYSIQGRFVTAKAPSDDDVLTWNDSESRWEPAEAQGGVSLAQAYAIASLRI